MNVNFGKVDIHINWTIVYIEMVLKIVKSPKALTILGFIHNSKKMCIYSSSSHKTGKGWRFYE